MYVSNLDVTTDMYVYLILFEEEKDKGVAFDNLGKSEKNILMWKTIRSEERKENPAW